LELRAPLDGAHTLEVIGTRAGRYDFEINYTDGQGSGDIHLEGIPTVPGAVHRYRLECARGAKPLVRLSGAFAASGLLTFASPSRPTPSARGRWPTSAASARSRRSRGGTPATRSHRSCRTRSMTPGGRPS